MTFWDATFASADEPAVAATFNSAVCARNVAIVGAQMGVDIAVRDAPSASPVLQLGSAAF